MKDNADMLVEMFNKAFCCFLEKEFANILSGVSERNLCSRLAILLNDELPEYGLSGLYVDTEYNRKQNGRGKTIIGSDSRIVSITCDLIIHSRGANLGQDNLLALEMKKSTRPTCEKDSDRERLIALTKEAYDGVWSNDGITLPEHVCGYKAGVYLEINVGSRLCLFELYQNGQKYKEWSCTIPDNKE